MHDSAELMPGEAPAQRAVDAEGIDLRQLHRELHELWMGEGGGTNAAVRGERLTSVGELIQRTTRALCALAYRVQCVDRPLSEREERQQRHVDQLATHVVAVRDYLSAILADHERHDHTDHPHCDAFAVAMEALGRLFPTNHLPHDFYENFHYRSTLRPVGEMAGMCRRYGELAARARVDADRAYHRGHADGQASAAMGGSDE